MREVAKLVLELVRYANRNNLDIGSALPPLVDGLQVTKGEMDEIIEIISADIREMNATYPCYGQVNERLRRMTAKNPDGV